MASFQIHRDNTEKENPGMPSLKEKTSMLNGAGGVKQPLAVIGGKEKALAPRANLVVLNTNNNHGNVQRGNPVPSGKMVRFHHNSHPNFVVVCCWVFQRSCPLLNFAGGGTTISRQNGGGFSCLSVCLSLFPCYSSESLFTLTHIVL